MNRLTNRQYWERVSEAEPAEDAQQRPESCLKRILKRAMGKRLFDLISPYDAYLLWRVVFPRYLPASCSGLSVVEIGSAPGDFLVQFANTFGATPYGVEYTRHGAERNRYNFARNGLDPDNVIEADFFSQEFLDAHSERFDIVISRGFIEHFQDVEAVVARHAEVLRPGGLLFLQIPSLRGVYYPWTKAFNPALLPLHNLDIMLLPSFRKLFERQPLEILRCSYFGTFSFWMFTAPDDARWLNRVGRGLIVLQRGLNLLFRLAFADRGCETAMFSPNLLFVGRKRGP